MVMSKSRYPWRINRSSGWLQHSNSLEPPFCPLTLAEGSATQFSPLVQRPTSSPWVSDWQSLLRGLRLALVATLILPTLSGCNRAQYRRSADMEVRDAVITATADPEFALPEFGIQVDPDSRLFDPTDPDRPPMPPDDPDSARFMECVDGHRGWKYWHKDGDVADVEVNDYTRGLPFNSEGKIAINQAQAVALARLNARDYQQQLETLYLSALDVTAERFRFQTQLFGGNATQYTTAGDVYNGGLPSQLLSTTNQMRAQRLFTAGGSLAVGLANTIVWQFAGPDTNSNVSLANFVLTQPLLQFAGKPRIMELLTRAERNLLANVRTFDRYQQGFYLDVVTGAPNGSTLQRAGGLFGGSGLTGFTGVGVGGFGGVGAIGLPVNNAIGGGGGTGAANLGGLLGFLQQQQFLKNQRVRIAGLRDTYLQLQSLFEAGRLDNRFQVDFARQAYFTNQSVYLNSLIGYRNALDGYKVRLGLPPHLPVEPQDDFFSQFELVDPRLTTLRGQVATRLEAISLEEDENPGVAEPSIGELTTAAGALVEDLNADLARTRAALPPRLRLLEQLATLPEVVESRLDPIIFSTRRPQEIVDQLSREAEQLRSRLAENIEASAAQQGSNTPGATPLELQIQRQPEDKEALNQLSAFLLELSLLQARARLHSINLLPINVSPEVAFHVALSRRADWMNAKASLVDTWRLIRFNANALRSNMSVSLLGDIGTTRDNPLNFGAANGRLSAGLTFDLPLTRVIERNQFRESLIVYQQARRSLMQFRDEIQRGLRARLRQIQLDQVNLELRRTAVDVAITQTDVARLKLIEPQKPVQEGKTNSTSPTVARDVVDALQNLNDAQQSLIQVWGDYEIQRRLLDFDMGTLQLNADGLWSDPGELTDDQLLIHCYGQMYNPFDTGFSPPSPEAAFDSPAALPPEPEALEDNPAAAPEWPANSP